MTRGRVWEQCDQELETLSLDHSAYHETSGERRMEDIILVENDDVDEEDCGQEASRDQAELHQLRGRKARMMEDADWSENDHVEECGALIGQLVSWLETRGHPQYPLPTSFQHRSEYHDLFEHVGLNPRLYQEVSDRRNKSRVWALMRRLCWFEHQRRDIS